MKSRSYLHLHLHRGAAFFFPPIKIPKIFLVAFLACASFYITTASAQTFTSGVWSYTVNGSNATIIAYSGSAGEVEIPSLIDGNAVKTIGGGSTPIFGGANSTVTKVTVPENVTAIAPNAFKNCTSLSQILLPSSVKTIEEYSFQNCSGLKSIKIPNNVISIGWWAFAGCTGLTDVTIPNSVTLLDSYAFAGCTGITKLSLGKNVARINYAAFEGCTGLTSIKLPSSVTVLGPHVFNGCIKLKNIYFLGNAPTVEYGVFWWLPVGTVYYTSGSTGWNTTFQGWPASELSAAEVSQLLSEEASDDLDSNLVEIAPTGPVALGYPDFTEVITPAN